LTEDGLKTHKAKAKHDFPAINARDWLVMNASKVGGALELGSRPNRRSHELFEPICAVDMDSPGVIDAQCYQCFNRTGTVTSISKTDGQLCFLLRCFGAENKLNPSQTMEKMKEEVDPVDNGLKFCSSKAHLQTNGSILSAEQIASWQSQEVKKRENGTISGTTRKKSF
jgi:hypothetical protein